MSEPAIPPHLQILDAAAAGSICASADNIVMMIGSLAAEADAFKETGTRHDAERLLNNLQALQRYVTVLTSYLEAQLREPKGP